MRLCLTFGVPILAAGALLLGCSTTGSPQPVTVAPVRVDADAIIHVRGVT